MKKQISSWMANFSANVVGVIIGIALTFGISYLVQRHNEKKQVREKMILLRQELQENKQWLQNRIADYKNDFGTYQVLLYTSEKVSKDSLIACIMRFNGGGDVSSASSNAWNMLQNSGTAQQLGDFELMSRLSECYFHIGKASEYWNDYIIVQDKASGIFDIMWEREPYAYVEALAKNEESRTFLRSYVMFNRYNKAYYFEAIISYIDYVLDLIDKKGDYNYEPKIRKDDFSNLLKKLESEKK